jgi:hypothetical protein
MSATSGRDVDPELLPLMERDPAVASVIFDLIALAEQRRKIAEIDCGWRWKAWPRFQVRCREEGEYGWVVYEVYTDGRELRIKHDMTAAQAREFAWAWRRDEA